MRTDLPWASYTRLTEDRHGKKIGAKVQRRYNLAWAKRNKIEIGPELDDTNLSAFDEDTTRPDFQKALQLLRDGAIGGIVVYRIDRLTRQRSEYEEIVSIVKKTRGVVAESYEGGQTTETLAGQRALRIEVDRGAAEVESIKIRVAANKQERTRRGYYHGGGHRPYGFEGPKKAKDGRIKNSGKIGIKHVEHEVANLQEAARRRLEGESYTDIVRDWHSRTPPVYGATGAPWNTKTLETALTSPRMIARQIYRVVDEKTGKTKESLRKAKWKPVLEVGDWEKLKAMRTTQAHAPIADYPLSGFALCGRCRMPLTGARRNYQKGGVTVGSRTYRCRSGMNDKARGHCGRLSVLADDVELVVAARVLRRIARHADLVRQVADDSEPQVELLRLSREIEHCNQELDLLAAVGEDPKQLLSVAQMLAYRKPFLDRIEAAEVRRREITRQLDLPTPEASDYEDLQAWWELLTCGQKRRLIEEYCAEVVVLAPGRSGRYFRPERVVVTPAGAKDADGFGDDSGVGDFNGDAGLGALVV